MFVWSKNRALKTVWLAGHIERKVLRSQINEASISAAVDQIIYPNVPFPLGVSAFLLLGVVRIYFRKVCYTLTVCNEAASNLRKVQLFSVESFPEAHQSDSGDLENLLDPFGEHQQDQQQFCSSSAEELHIALPEHITLQQNLDNSRCNFHLEFELDERFPDGSLDFSYESSPADDFFQPRTPPPQVLADYRSRFSCESSPPAKVSLNFDAVDTEICKSAADASVPEVAFAPLTPKQLRYSSRTTRKRKRLVFDAVTVLPFENQHSPTEDIRRPTKRAPRAIRTSQADYFAVFSVAGICGKTHNALRVTSSKIKRLRNTPVQEEIQVSTEYLACEIEEQVHEKEFHNERNVDKVAQTDAFGNFEADENAATAAFDMGCDHYSDNDQNCGWSSRTKAVALYLKERFKQQSTANLNLGQVLSSTTTKRRAACIFFDLLVLKSKACVHVQQVAPFDDIVITPLTKLMEVL